MNDNPFSKLIEVMKEDKKSSFFFGKVTGLDEVTTQGIKLYKEDLERASGLNLKLGDKVFLYNSGEKILIICKVVDHD